MAGRSRGITLLLSAALMLGLSAVGAAGAGAVDGVGVFDPGSGLWYLRDSASGATTSFYFGNPGDQPFMGDWNCDGVDTPGLFRNADGYIYLRNSNSQGIADVSFFFGNPGDIPLAGDFNGDGCDSVSIYRPSAASFFVTHRLGSADAGLGAADFVLQFGDFGDQPLAGDFDGDGVDEIGVARDGSVHLRLATGVTSMAVGSARDSVLAGAWSSGADALAVHRPDAGSFVLLNGDGSQLTSFSYGNDTHKPVAGTFGILSGGADPPPDQPPYPNVGSGRRIIYSNGQQRVWLIEEDGTVAKTHLVSGRAGVPAPGTYSVYSKSVNANSHNGITMTHMVRFAHGARLPYGFHSIPKYANGQPMQTEAELGYYRSGGCVRQRYEYAVFLYEWAPLGTTVHVVP